MMTEQIGRNSKTNSDNQLQAVIESLRQMENQYFTTSESVNHYTHSIQNIETVQDWPNTYAKSPEQLAKESLFQLAIIEILEHFNETGELDEKSLVSIIKIARIE